MLTKEIQSSEKLFEKIGRPEFVLQMVASIEDAVNAKYDKLNAQNKKNMNTLRNKVKKYLAGSKLEEDLKKL